MMYSIGGALRAISIAIGAAINFKQFQITNIAIRGNYSFNTLKGYISKEAK